jgi:mannose-6-phosphate isomerase-like protein (cupin superfamily)
MADSLHLQALRALIPNLPQIVADRQCGVVEYVVEQGTCIGICLFKPADSNIAVQRSFLSAGTIFTKHQHEDMHETLILYQGQAIVHMPDGSVDLQHGVPHYVPPGTSHDFTAVTDCWVIGITQPGSKGYPSARDQ